MPASEAIKTPRAVSNMDMKSSVLNALMRSNGPMRFEIEIRRENPARDCACERQALEDPHQVAQAEIPKNQAA